MKKEIEKLLIKIAKLMDKLKVRGFKLDSDEFNVIITIRKKVKENEISNKN